MLSRDWCVCRSTLLLCRLSDAVMLAVPEMNVVTNSPVATAMARTNLGVSVPY